MPIRRDPGRPGFGRGYCISVLWITLREVSERPHRADRIPYHLNHVCDLCHRTMHGYPQLTRIEPIDKLLDEILQGLLWRCGIMLDNGESQTDTIFHPRSPELLTLSNLPENSSKTNLVIVYPNPPLGIAEQCLFHKLAPHIKLRHLSLWQAEKGELTHAH